MLNISLIFPALWKTRGNFTGPMPRLSTYLLCAGHCPSQLNDLSISLMASISQRRKLRLPENEGPFPRPQGYATSSAPHPSLGRFSWGLEGSTLNCVIRLIWSLFSSETSSRESVTEKWGSLWLGCFAPKVLLPMRLSPLRPPQASTRALGCWVGRPDAVFCRGWGVPPWGSHSPPPFRPRFSAPHPFHVFFFFLLQYWFFILLLKT